MDELDIDELVVKSGECECRICAGKKCACKHMEYAHGKDGCLYAQCECKNNK